MEGLGRSVIAHRRRPCGRAKDPLRSTPLGHCPEMLVREWGFDLWGAWRVAPIPRSPLRAPANAAIARFRAAPRAQTPAMLRKARGARARRPGDRAARSRDREIAPSRRPAAIATPPLV